GHATPPSAAPGRGALFTRYRADGAPSAPPRFIPVQRICTWLIGSASAFRRAISFCSTIWAGVREARGSATSGASGAGRAGSDTRASVRVWAGEVVSRGTGVGAGPSPLAREGGENNSGCAIMARLIKGERETTSAARVMGKSYAAVPLWGTCIRN